MVKFLLFLNNPSEEEEKHDKDNKERKEERKVKRTGYTATYSSTSAKCHKVTTSLNYIFFIICC